MKKKVLITSESLQTGGVEKALIELLNNLSPNEYEIDLYLLEGGEFTKFIPQYINLHLIEEVTKKPYNRNLLTRITKTLFTKKIIKRYNKLFIQKYDILIAYYGINNYSDLFGVANAKKKILWQHNDFNLSYKNSSNFKKSLLKLRNYYLSKKLKYFDSIVCVSKTSLKGFNKIFPGYEEKTRLIYNYANENIKNLSLEKSNYDLDANYFNIATVGRLVPGKNNDLLIEIIAKLRNKKCKIKTYIVGSGPELQKLQNLSNKYNLEDHITLTGQLDNPYPLIKNSNLIISLSNYESFGLSLFEAIILNTPILTINNGGGEEIVKEIAPPNCGTIASKRNVSQILEEIVSKKIELNINVDFNLKKYNEDITNNINDLLK